MREFDFYKREKLADNLWVVTESYGVNSTFRIYVLTGGERTVVIDSGLGAQSGLRRYIETFIADPNKPMSALLTHTHPDHVGGAPLFDEVYVNPLEFPDLDWNRNFYRRFGDLEWFCGHDRWKEAPDHDVMNFCFEHFVREVLREEDCKKVNDGDILRFGDITLEAIFCPTHSKGSTCYYDRASKRLFAGDAVQHWNGYPGPDSVDWMDRLISMMPEDVAVLNAHDEGVYGMALLRDFRRALWELKSRVNIENDPPQGYTNHFHVKKPSQSAAPADMRDHFVNDVRISYNANDFKDIFS